jgi:hypothetical protein
LMRFIKGMKNALFFHNLDLIIAEFLLCFLPLTLLAQS